MTNYLVVNSSGTAYTDINGGGTDVPAYSSVDAVTLTITELAAAVALTGCIVYKTAPTSAQRRMAAKVLRLDCNPGA